MANTVLRRRAADWGVPREIPARRRPPTGAAMTLSRRIPLNPCDYLYFAHHGRMQREAQAGNVAFMVFEAEGRAEPDRVIDALAAAMLAHPVTMASLRISLVGGRPYWQTPDPRPRAARRAAQQAYGYDDLRKDSADWSDRLERLCETRNVPHWDLTTGPQLGLEHYDLPDQRTRFCFRFPHVLMDADGIQWFASEMGRLQTPGPVAGEGAARGFPPGLVADDQPLDVLAGVSIKRRLGLFGEAFTATPERRRLRIKPLLDGPPGRRLRQRLIHKCWPARELVRMRGQARRWAPPGPAHHARYLVMCVIRALHRLYTERGVKTDAYLVPFPINLTAISGAGNGPVPRPVPGNYLVSPTICAGRDLVEDKAALGREVLRQIEAYNEKRMHLAQWSVIWLASLMRASMYRWALRLPLGLETLASGFSYYGPISRRIRSIVGTRITNMWGCAPMGMPPGWNPIFNKFEGRMNLVLSWAHPAIPAELARRYVDLIEEEIFDWA